MLVPVTATVVQWFSSMLIREAIVLFSCTFSDYTGIWVCFFLLWCASLKTVFYPQLCLHHFDLLIKRLIQVHSLNV